MSKANENTNAVGNGAGTAGATFVAVDENNGQRVEFIRPSMLSEPGIILEGIYVGASENSLDSSKFDYAFELGNGTKTVINSTASLARQMKKVSEGELVQIEYLGKVKTQSGKLAHNFIVRAARTA